MRRSTDPHTAPKLGRAGLAALAGLALVASPLVAAPANAISAGVVISEVYGGGGNTGAPVNEDFVELYNPTSAAIAVGGMSVQYRAATSTAAPTSDNVIALTGSVPAGGHYLVGGAFGANTAATALPTPDVTGTAALGSTAGVVFLANQTAALPALPAASTLDNPAIIDLVGYGSATTVETTAAPAASNSTSVHRVASDSGADTDNNSADFVAGAPTPANSGATSPPPPADPVPATIEQLQGSTDTSPYAGSTVVTDGVVTAAYPTGGFAGYYLQTAGTGGAIDFATHTASDAVFVYAPSSVASVSVGQHLEVTGTVSEFHGLTELAATSSTVLPDAASPTPVTTTIPLSADHRESLEGMLVAPSGDYTITDNYNLNAFGEVALVQGTSPLLTPTVAAEPGAAAVAYAAANAEKIVTLDDGASLSYLTNDAAKDVPLPYLSATSPMRIGTPATFTRPVIFDYRNDGWDFQPTSQLTGTNAATVQPATFTNTRTSGPKDVGGDVTLASFNVLNYFPTTGDQLTGCSYYTDRDGNPITVNTGCDARGAANAENLARQQAKIVKAINSLGADVVSLEEIENSIRFGKNRDGALSILVAALNADAGSAVWSYVPSPLATPASQDVIRTAFIYRSTVVKPVGSSVILDDPAFADARQPLAQEFALASTDASSPFLAIVNHFKSKGSGDGVNADQGDGQGASNPDRVAQAKALVAFASTMKARTGADRVFLSGDFNAYLKEDPIDVITAAGYTDLGSALTTKYTYAFDGAVGSLDHIFVSNNALADVASADIWNVNAYESVAMEYSRYNYNATDFYAPDPYRASDHDPILVGITLRSAIAAHVPKIVGKNKVGATLTARTGTWDPRPVRLSYRWLNNGKPIAGAAGKSYRLKKSDTGDHISVRVTGRKSGYPTVVLTSAAVKVYRALTATPRPHITGVAKTGHTLAVTAGKWKPVPVHLTYRWYRNGVPIAHATGKKYHLTTADKGKKITIKVTGSKKGYLTESETRSVARIR
jgi:5'-nucleotidase